MFDLAALESADGNGLWGSIFAGKLHFSAVTDSTNNDALAAARNGAPHGSVYFADEQIAGRGRGNHAWHSAAGEGLYVSILLRPQIPAARLALLPLLDPQQRLVGLGRQSAERLRELLDGRPVLEQELQIVPDG